MEKDKIIAEKDQELIAEKQRKELKPKGKKLM
jgi:hypothetical protein